MTYPPGEIGFKLAACALVLRGRYPSGRAILNELGRTGRTKGRKCQLNGRECEWKFWIFKQFGIEPYLGYTTRRFRSDWEEYLGLRGIDDCEPNPPFEYRLRRGPRGSLVQINPKPLGMLVGP